jgi:titin
MTLSSGTAQDGTWSKTVTIPGTATPGAWTVTINALSDTLGNGDGTAHNHPTKLTVTNTVVATAPGAPTGVTATGGNGQAHVSWTAPAANGSPITGYTVIGSPGGFVKTVAGGQTNGTVTGLNNGTEYRFTVIASNAIGNSPASAASNAVTPAAPATVPAAPTGVAATAGDALAFVSWTAAAANGSPITGYRVTAWVNGQVARTTTVGGASVSVTMTGLANGTTYVFTVTAINGVGDSPASAASQPVTPAAPVVNPPSGPDPACVAAKAHLATVSGVLQQAQRGLATAKKKLKAAKAAPASVRASKVKKAKAKVAAATQKVKAAQGAVSAAQGSVTAACR